MLGGGCRLHEQWAAAQGLSAACPPAPAPLPAPLSTQIPKDLAKYAKMIVEADGFAQVYPEHKVR